MNKRLFFKMSLATLSVLALFSQSVLAEENIHFSSCKEAWANGYSDFHKGDPGYSAKLDRDHDGVACELKNAPKGAFKAKQETTTQTDTSSSTTSGWVKQDGAWYYFDGNGNPVKNAWKGSYYLKADGKMAQSEWIYDSSYQAWYYLKSDGSYAYSTWQGNYYLKSDGKMAKGEWVYDSSYQAWYYLTSDGSYAYSTWQGNYYLKSDGKMAVNEWVDGGRYYVDTTGLWKANSKVSNKGSYYSLQGKYDEIVVANKHYPMSKDYYPGENATAKAAFLKLIEQMKEEGYAISDNYSGFRSYATQAQLYQSYVNQEGQAAADRYSARPGYSEHQTGLAFDVIGTDGQLVEDAGAAQWLLDHAPDYGFVVRYPRGKESITGYMHEEWHLRYIGKEAKDIAASGLTLEEYYGFDGGDYLD
ncbi:LD-carboxypeptidase LdcB/DacB [Streptococcus mitis]|uniref:Serine-type D-Ala-D-Ala carboxypeptidase n=1 Tax=Streptococcus mitis SK1080 TaxID=1008453 RepID=F9HP16_STRMT|nr:serine-type D-Ala-D-Ala carboxypeptidase [Streptococcus mitis SK1080]